MCGRGINTCALCTIVLSCPRFFSWTQEREGGIRTQSQGFNSCGHITSRLSCPGKERGKRVGVAKANHNVADPPMKRLMKSPGSLRITTADPQMQHKVRWLGWRHVRRLIQSGGLNTDWHPIWCGGVGVVDGGSWPFLPATVPATVTTMTTITSMTTVTTMTSMTTVTTVTTVAAAARVIVCPA